MSIRARASITAAAALVVLVGALGVAVDLARAADECRGLQTCLPVAGPWVKIPAPAKGSATSAAVWELRCPLRGYIVAGIDARVSDEGVDVSIRGETGSPVAPGVTTGDRVLFVATWTGAARRATSFRPFIGCVPVSGGGGRSATSYTRVPAAFVPSQPIERRVASAAIAPGQSRTVVATCRAGERLIGSDRAIALNRETEPARAQLAALRISGASSGKRARARASAAASLPARSEVVAQVHALCARGAS